LEVDSSTHETISSFVHFTRLQYLSLLPPRGKNSDSLYMDILTRETSIALLFFPVSERAQEAGLSIAPSL